MSKSRRLFWVKKEEKNLQSKWVIPLMKKKGEVRKKPKLREGNLRLFQRWLFWNHFPLFCTFYYCWLLGLNSLLKFHQKNTNRNLSTEKLLKTLLYEKAGHKMLMKLTAVSLLIIIMPCTALIIGGFFKPPFHGPVADPIKLFFLVKEEFFRC